MNASTFQAVMKLHLNERELFVIQAFGNNRLRVNSGRSVGECGGEIKARRHCLSLDPDAALHCWGIAHLQCRNQPHPLSSYPHRANGERIQTFSLHLKITLLAVFLSCLSNPPLASSLWNSFISQTSVGNGESLISQGLSFKFHYWDWMQMVPCFSNFFFSFLILF